jgi:hypothetical protein
LIGGAAVGIAGAYFWLREKADEPVKKEAASRPLVVVASGDTAGWIVPCGCASNQSGGMPRRGSHIAELRRENEVLVLDAGGAPAGTSRYDRLKFEAILKGEKLLGVAAHNLGGPEAALGADTLRQIAKRTETLFVSANFQDADGQLVGEPYVLLKSSAGMLAVIGVLSPSFETSDCRISDPREAVLALLPQIEGRYDWLAILGYLPEEELRNFAASLPEADLVIGGPTGQCLAPVEIGPTLLTSATNKGKFLVELRAPAGSGARRWQGRIAEMNNKLTDDARQIENLAAFRRVLEEEDIPAIDSGLVARQPGEFPETYRAAGVESCRACHAGDCRLWDDSKHAHAWSTLADQGAHVDSYCQQCHTTAFGLPGGFVSVLRTSDRVDVGCESCHGPSQSHALDPSQPTPLVARDQCVFCHDRENSPRFEYAAYWEQIVHGEESETSLTEAAR